MPWPNRELQHRAPVPPVSGLSPAAAGERVLRQPDGLGTGELLRPAGRARRDRVCWGKQNWQPWSAAEQRATRQRGGRVRPDLVLQVPAHRPGCGAGAAVAVHRRTSPCGPAGPSTPGCSTTAAPTSPTSPSPGCRLASSCWSAAPRRRNATRTTSAGTSRPDARATLVDVTSGYAVYGVMGPAVPGTALAGSSRSDLGDEAFPFGSSRESTSGTPRSGRPGSPTSGELGWELYVPAEFAVGVYQDLMTAGAGPRRRQRRLLRHRVDAAGEGLPRVRPRADPGL